MARLVKIGDVESAPELVIRRVASSLWISMSVFDHNRATKQDPREAYAVRAFKGTGEIPYEFA
jgi:hypothetical protein